jgi:hypothetical protein
MAMLLCSIGLIGFVVVTFVVIAQSILRGTNSFVTDTFSSLGVVFKPIFKHLGMDIDDPRNGWAHRLIAGFSVLTVAGLLILLVIALVTPTNPEVTGANSFPIFILFSIVAFGLGFYIGKDIYRYIAKAVAIVRKETFQVDVKKQALTSLGIGLVFIFPFIGVFVINTLGLLR